MPVTRGRAKAGHSASATPTTAVSPLFSARASTRSTPDTSAIDEDDDNPKQDPKTSSTARGKKRVLEDDSEEEQKTTKGSKRRVDRKAVYVEVPTRLVSQVRSARNFRTISTQLPSLKRCLKPPLLLLGSDAQVEPQWPPLS